MNAKMVLVVIQLAQKILCVQIQSAVLNVLVLQVLVDVQILTSALMDLPIAMRMLRVKIHLEPIHVPVSMAMKARGLKEPALM